MNGASNVADRRSKLSDAKRALLAQRMKAGKGQAPVGIPRREDASPPPLSTMQERLWYLAQAEGQSVGYNIVAVYRALGPLEPKALETALVRLVSRHEVLRTRFELTGDHPVQVVSPDANLTLGHVAVDDAGARAQLGARLSAAVNEPFDLERGPLLRATLFRLAAEEYILCLVAHHTVFDGESFAVLQAELAALYREASGAEPAALAPLSIQYADFAAWERARADGDEAQTDVDYFVERLSGELPELSLPFDRPRPPVPHWRGAVRTLFLSEERLERLDRVARAASTSRYSVMLAALQVWLGRIGGQDDVIVGTALGAGTRQTEPLVGFFANTVAIRSDLSAGPTFRQAVERVRDGVLEALSHRSAPFERVVRRLRLPRDRSRTPVFQVLFFQEDRPLTFSMGDVSLEAIPLFPEAALTDLTFIQRGPDLHLLYATELFDEATAAGLLDSFDTLLDEALARPELPVGRLPLVSVAERRRLLSLASGPVTTPPDRTIVGLVGRQMARAPERIAVVSGGQALTYGQLDEQSNQLARHLSQVGVGRGSLVGVCVERSASMLVAVLAVLKAGGAYVPLDPDYPPERLSYMLADCGSRVLLTEQRLESKLPSVVPTVVRLDAERELIRRSSSAPLEVDVSPDDLAYVIYTSGSTGKPKGVLVSHGAAANFLSSMARRPGLGQEDTLLAVTTLSFDIAVLELYLPLSVGARVVIASRAEASDGQALLDLMKQHQVNVIQATPATWILLLDSGWSEDQPLRVLCGGEAMTRALAERLLGRATSVWNLYGPTETTVWSTCARVGSEDGTLGAVPIGRPIDNTRVYVLDRDGELVPIGVAGELYIGGAGVAKGYLGKKALTDERFVPDPFGDDPAGRLYRTGDRVRFRRDGLLEYLERVDHQVKVRGYRIELGEVESALLSHEGVRRAVVTVREDRPGDRRLAAYVVLVDDVAPSIEALRAHVGRSLPAYMIPSVWTELGELPLSPSGKVDRKRLPAPGLPQHPDGTGALPRTETETRVAGVFAEVLGLPRVGVEDDFFDLGGHSLLAVRLAARLSESFGASVPLSAVLAGPTVEQLARVVDDGGAAEQPAVITLQQGQGGVPLFCICGINLYLELSRALSEEVPVYGVFVPAEAAFFADGNAAERSQGLPTVEELAAAYVDAIRSAQPHGPYALLGLCFGGLLAYEIAGQLTDAGEDVALLAMAEIVLPSGMRFQSMRWAGAHLGKALKKGPRYVAERFEEKLRNARSRLGGRSDGQGERWADVRNHAYRRAIDLYDRAPRAYTGDVLILRAEDEPFFPGYRVEDDGGFSRLVRGTCEVHWVPGDHLGILQEPNVHQVASVLGPRIDRVRGVPSDEESNGSGRAPKPDASRWARSEPG